MFDVVGDQDLNFIIEPGSQVIQVLGIGDEDIDILAKAMMMPSHEHRSAAKGPILERIARLCH